MHATRSNNFVSTTLAVQFLLCEIDFGLLSSQAHL